VCIGGVHRFYRFFLLFLTFLSKWVPIAGVKETGNRVQETGNGKRIQETGNRVQEQGVERPITRPLGCPTREPAGPPMARQATGQPNEAE